MDLDGARAFGSDAVGIGRAGLLDLVASPRELGGGIAHPTHGYIDALGSGFDRLENLW